MYLLVLLTDMSRTQEGSTYPKPQNCARKLIIIVKASLAEIIEKQHTTQKQLSMPKSRHLEGHIPKRVSENRISVHIPGHPTSRLQRTNFGLWTASETSKEIAVQERLCNSKRLDCGL
jgi:hypothetical protein